MASSALRVCFCDQFTFSLLQILQMKSAFFFFDDDTLDEEDDDDDAVEEDLFVFFLSSTGMSRQC